MTPSKNLRELRIKVFLQILKRNQMHRRIPDPVKRLRQSILRI